MLKCFFISIIFFCHFTQASQIEMHIPMRSPHLDNKILQSDQAVNTSNTHPDYFYMPVGKQPNSGITYFQYLEIMQYFSKLYPQIQFPIEWVEPYFAAFAKKEKNIRQVHVWGGLVRMPNATLPVVLTAICHEVGHHLGGAPYQDQVFGGEWASAEGQADYFAARYCLPRTYFDHPEWFSSLEKDFKNYAEVQNKQLQMCLLNQLCRVSILSGYQMFQKFSELPHSMPEKFEFAIKSEPTNHSILNTYPPLQCRFETYFSGGYCFVDSQSPLCRRPSCWFIEAEK